MEMEYLEEDYEPKVSKEMSELLNRANESIGQNDYDTALKIADQIKEMPDEPGKSIILGGLYIDSGSFLSNDSVIKHGIEILEKDHDRYASDDIQPKERLAYFYFLGNGHMTLAVMKRGHDQTYGYFQQEKSDLFISKEYFRKALKYASNDLRTAQAHVNLGNILDGQGRCLDALDCYEKAILIVPGFGMALGNKGMALAYYASICGKNQVLILSEAYHCLDLACRSQSHTPDYAKQNFLEEKEKIEHSLGEKLVHPPFSKKFNNPGESEIERDYLNYGLEHGLYLNLCNHCSLRCSKAVVDTFTLERMTVPVNINFETDPFLRFQNWMNQIRTAFATARYILFQATNTTKENEFILKHVLIVETLDYSIYDVETEYLKIAFRSFYTILDQLASLLNDYLDLQIQLHKIYFSDVWFEGGNKKGVLRQKILEKESWVLNALYEINIDLQKSEYYKQLPAMRNVLTHRFIHVRDFQINPSSDKMDKEELEKRTIDLARLVRNAIAYMMFFLWKDTQEQSDKHSGYTPKITLPKRQ